MQRDMHYYGCFFLARAAGFATAEAVTIATASQYVDDNVKPDMHVFADGGAFEFVPTAHHPVSRANLDHDDQRRIWVPFHFLPGGGATIDGITPRTHPDA